MSWGTKRPWAVSRTARAATRPSQATLGPIPSSPAVSPSATSQPRQLSTGAETVSARLRPPSLTGRYGAHSTVEPPQSSRRALTPSALSGGAPWPAAQAMTRPGIHESCSSATPASGAPFSEPPPSGARGGPTSSDSTPSTAR